MYFEYHNIQSFQSH